MAEGRDRIMAFSVAFVTHPGEYLNNKEFIKHDIQKYESGDMLERGSGQVYLEFMKQDLEAQRQKLKADPKPVLKALFSILEKVREEPALTSSVLATLDGILVDDHYLVTEVLRLDPDSKFVGILKQYLTFGSYSALTIEAAAHVLSIVISEMAIKRKSALEHGKTHMEFLVNQAPSEIGLEAVVYALVPILKVDSFKEEFLKTGGMRAVLVPMFEQKSGFHQAMYSTICCLWMISLNKELQEYFLRKDYDIIHKVIKELKRTEKEKVIRVALGTLKNLTNNEDAVEVMVDKHLLNTIDNISRRVIKDQDVVELVKDMGDIMESSIKVLSTYEKWLKELEKGQLVPGVTHTESFWKENAKHLEENTFLNLKKLVGLLDSDDAQTVVLALHDIGEFSRHHPYGKTVVDKVGGKIKAMELLQSEEPQVNQAALLCIQKIMIRDWQQLS